MDFVYNFTSRTSGVSKPGLFALDRKSLHFYLWTKQNSGVQNVKNIAISPYFA